MSTVNPETERRLQNLNNLGTVAAINGGKCRVKIGDNLTDWLPFSSGRSGGVKFWNPPHIGEQVMVTSPTGELESAYVSASIPSDTNQNPSSNQTEPAIHMPDGAVFKYDHASSTLTIALPASSTVALTCKDITINAENCTTTATKIDLNGLLTINGKPYLEHMHLGVKSGPDNSQGIVP